MGTRSLDVMIAGEHAGVLSQGESGALSFAYLRGYRGIPLSSAMPLSTRTYRDKVVLPYLWGLLPEDPITRARVAADAGISPNNPFALLGSEDWIVPVRCSFVRPIPIYCEKSDLSPSTLEKSREDSDFPIQRSRDRADATPSVYNSSTCMESRSYRLTWSPR